MRKVLEVAVFVLLMLPLAFVVGLWLIYEATA